jgi:UDP-N-acetylmuramoyl-L-alanyl-D-glutamate--2,6-diaminopimelate ligase
MEMNLLDLLDSIEYSVLQGSSEIEVNHIAYDSRKVEKGDLFVCITGFQTDGHGYAKKAVENGAIAILCEKAIEGIPTDITIIQTDNTRKAIAMISSNFYHHPSEEMNVIGVTGTNGKTTTTYLMKSILDKIGHKVGVIGTIENRIGEKVIPTERTTPESLELQALLRQMKEEEVTDVVMEVSSHSLDLHRVDGIRYRVGIFTNLTQDHLDYHKTMENYKKAKSLLFQRCEGSVINVDDPAGEYMVEQSKGKVLTFGIENKADLQAEEIHISADGVHFVLEYNTKRYPVMIHTPGRFSIYNALGAIGASLLLGIDMDTIIKGLAENSGVSGRFQRVKSKRGYHAIVDYAHTPDGLENILNTAKEFVEGRVITVFGCGGDRDRTKRPIMGEIAGNLSDYCVITSDNPRTEDPVAILADVEQGVKKTGCDYVKFVDRREAICHAVEYAKEGDIVIIAGKGHETYQIFPDKTIHFDDVEEVRKAFGEDAI